MNIEQIVFYFLSAVVLVSALLVVAMKNLVRSIFLFFLTLFSMAGLFVFALADFVAITQVVVYVGGVLVLMIFAFLLSNRDILNNPDAVKINGKFLTAHHLPGLVVSFLFFTALMFAFSQFQVDELEWIAASEGNTLSPSDNTIELLGINIMTRYLLPFETISVLLMLALIGAAHLARKERKI
ncbi:NADH-quinone oxidoreductase subunit J [Pedobacter sp. SYSU D00535]|uniref:NADH-quinone oxidoreductase subunit J family protein n=1 Tax=Pedobacter sp. SYSU D00535 TaxID=2810308 RepID=UPI001A96B90C|nr:NADH-quinone oxidoreductase subunit J [Pedobacter sp. SYSU D00535]